MLSTVISVVAALGIGSLIGALFTYYLEQRKQLNQQQNELKHKRYLAILILMLAKLEPASRMRQINEIRPDLRDLGDVDAEIRAELLNAALFASDDVIKALAIFAQNSNYSTYGKTVAAMRKDLWKNKTAIDEKTLEIAMRSDLEVHRNRSLPEK